MKLKVEHTTRFDYDAPVYETATELRLTPINWIGCGQHRLDFALTVTPAAKSYPYFDTYGNTVEYFNLLHSNSSLEISTVSTVETGLLRSNDPEDPIRLQDYLMESDYVALDNTVADFVRPFGKAQEQFVQADHVARSINDAFVYVPGVTDVHSKSVDVIALKQGVCQDFAHVMIACCRTLGLPARYVSGYLYGGEESEGADRASHAWCEVYCDGCWRGFDPTHDNIYPDERYIEIGFGRDYGDVPPVRGTYKGVAKEKLSVVVRVTDVDRFRQ
jgi:transglutaminase-like putative cysteine protease